MGAKSNSGKVPGAARRRDACEQTAQVPGELDHEIDCQRIFQGDRGRSPALYFD